MAPRAGAVPDAGVAPSRHLRSFAVSFLIVVASTIIGAVIGMGGARFVFAIAEGEARGGLFVVAGILILAGAGLGLVAGAVYAGWRLHKQTVAVETGTPYLRD